MHLISFYDNWFLYIASPQQGDLMLPGPPSGQGAGGRARTRDRKVPADLRADSQATVPPTPPRSTIKLFLLQITYRSLVKPDCRPAEEGQAATLTCRVSPAALACASSVSILVWRVNIPTSVITCSVNGCGGGYSSRYGFSATISPSGSTLTISDVSRTVPFNMETRWTCWPCADASSEVTVCDKLEVYGELLFD
ncbi:hypothetical protein PoB_005380400 [Plakobranchus ocellatus]|uniref:Ig-like domain-containing protein n=1 Tax=Plakobranchus ocellatus TaxID=259542 RepID=A0AAV4C9C4_9GAST|nr:hypothetical protein PoB_005380400 [Plakobranchus ocellatus]